MPAKTSAAKRQRQSEQARVRNQATLSRVRTTVRKLHEAVGAGAADQVAEQLAAVTRELDRAVSKGVLKRNTAARRKRRLHQQATRALASTANA